MGSGFAMSFVHWERDVEGAGGVASTDGSRVRECSAVGVDSDGCNCNIWGDERKDREE